MRTRSFLILSVVTAAVTAAAAMAVLRQQAPQTVVASGGPVFPGLVGKLGEVASVEVRDAAGTLTIRRVDGGWGLVERGDYPVAPEKVRELVSQMVQLEKAEAKTSRPDRYARLGVEDLQTPDARSKQVTLQTAAGAPVAQVIVGIPGSGVGAEGATYVRLPGDPQTWLARGTLAPSTEPRDWVERRLLQVPSADVREVRIVQTTGATLTAVRDPGGSGGFRLVELPKGAKLSRPDAVDALVEALAEVPLEDLAPVGSIDFPAKGTLRVTVTRNDSGPVKFEIVERDGEHWLRFVGDDLPAGVPAAARTMAFRIPTWKVTPLDRKLSELVEGASGS